MYQYGLLAVALALFLILGAVNSASGEPGRVRFSQSAPEVEAYDFVEVTVSVDGPDTANPFTEVTVEAGNEFSGIPVIDIPECGQCAACAGLDRHAGKPESGPVIPGRGLAGAECQ